MFKGWLEIVTRLESKGAECGSRCPDWCRWFCLWEENQSTLDAQMKTPLSPRKGRPVDVGIRQLLLRLSR